MGGGHVNIEILNNKISHRIPSSQECLSCHLSKEESRNEFYSHHYHPLYLIGNKVNYQLLVKEQQDKGLNFMLGFKPGVLRLESLNHLENIFTNEALALYKNAARNLDTESLEARVSMYISRNCMQCHNGNIGPNFKGRLQEIFINKKSLRGDKVLVLPGKAKESFLYQQVLTKTMPPGIHNIDVKFLKMIKDWINQLE